MRHSFMANLVEHGLDRNHDRRRDNRCAHGARALAECGFPALAASKVGLVQAAEASNEHRIKSMS
jgi:hypothetical protein